MYANHTYIVCTRVCTQSTQGMHTLTRVFAHASIPYIHNAPAHGLHAHKPYLHTHLLMHIFCILQTSKAGQIFETFSIEVGTYQLTLKFAEPEKNASGQRVFNATYNLYVSIDLRQSLFSVLLFVLV